MNRAQRRSDAGVFGSMSLPCAPASLRENIFFTENGTRKTENAL